MKSYLVEVKTGQTVRPIAYFTRQLPGSIEVEASSIHAKRMPLVVALDTCDVLFRKHRLDNRIVDATTGDPYNNWASEGAGFVEKKEEAKTHEQAVWRGILMSYGGDGKYHASIQLPSSRADFIGADLQDLIERIIGCSDASEELAACIAALPPEPEESPEPAPDPEPSARPGIRPGSVTR